MFNSSLKCPPRTLASISSTATVHLAFGFHPLVAIPFAFVRTSDLVNVNVAVDVAAICHVDVHVT